MDDISVGNTQSYLWLVIERSTTIESIAIEKYYSEEASRVHYDKSYSLIYDLYH